MPNAYLEITHRKTVLYENGDLMRIKLCFEDKWLISINSKIGCPNLLKKEHSVKIILTNFRANYRIQHFYNDIHTTYASGRSTQRPGTDSNRWR